MTMTTTYSTLAPKLDIGTSNPLLDMFSKISTVYSDSMQADASQLWMSSARIIQEYSLKAMMNASQECMAALTQNAASIQQQSMVHLGSANQKAVEIMADTIARAMAGRFKPSI